MPSSYNHIKPYKVVFNDGPCDGAIRYYSTFYNAKCAARRYIKNRLSGRFVFTYPSCEIFLVDENGVCWFLTLVTHK